MECKHNDFVDEPNLDEDIKSDEYKYLQLDYKYIRGNEITEE